MKEIKIRYYRRRTNEMAYDLVTEINPDGSFGTVEDSEWTIFGGLSTGLKDKNGVEIYEGDITSLKYDSDEGEKTAYMPIVFDNGAFWVDESFHRDGTSLSLLCEYDEQINIVGNIHQNPELL